MARLTNHFENDKDTGHYTAIKHHDTTRNETHDENAPPQPPADLIDPASALCAPHTPASSELPDALLASPAARPAPPPSVASEVAGSDDAFDQIGSPRLTSSRHSAKLSESLSSSSPRWSYENLRNQRWSYNSDVMEKGVHDLKTLGEHEGERGHGVQNGESFVEGAATKDEMNLTDSPLMLAASRTAPSSKLNSASVTTHAAPSPKPLIDGPDHNDEVADSDTATEQASPTNGHHDAPPSPLVLPQASLADKVDLNHQENTVADSDFTMRGLGSAIVASETEQDPTFVRDPLMLPTADNPLMLSPQSYSSIMEKRMQDAKSDEFSAFSSSDRADDQEQEASHTATTSNTTSHTHIPPLDTKDQVSASGNASAASVDLRIDSAVAAVSPARPKVTWDDQESRTSSGRRVSRNTFTVGQRRPSILLNGIASSSTPAATSQTTDIAHGTTNKNLDSSTSTLHNGSHKPTTPVLISAGEYVVGSPPNSNAKLFVIMLLSLSGGYLVIRTVRELLGNWGVQGCLMLLGAVLMMRRSV